MDRDESKNPREGVASTSAFQSIVKKLHDRPLTPDEALAVMRGEKIVGTLVGITGDEMYEVAVRAFALVRAAYHDKAEQLFEILAYLDSSHPYFRNGAGVAQLGQKKLDQAEESFRRAIALDPKNPSPHVNLGETLLHKGQVKAGMVALREATKLDPEEKDPFVTRARQFIQAVESRGGAEAVEAEMRAFMAGEKTKAEERPSKPAKAKASRGDRKKRPHKKKAGK